MSEECEKEKNKMTNREWLFEEMKNMSDEELIKFDISQFICKSIKNSECENWAGGCIDCKINWLKAEHKEQITLSEAERVILENIDKNFKWIAREEDGELFLFKEKPCKQISSERENNFWITSSPRNERCLEIYKHLFKFISWNDVEAYNIEELLKNQCFK